MSDFVSFLFLYITGALAHIGIYITAEAKPFRSRLCLVIDFCDGLKLRISIIRKA